jgi:putative ABC transport system ATP-binding protein
MPFIEITDLRRQYVLGDVTVHALRGVTLSIEAGSFVAVVGASGSGKSTLMNILGLLDRPTGGRYNLQGEDVSTIDPDRRARLRNQKIGFVFQSFNLIPDLDLFDNVDVPLRYRGLARTERKRRIESALERVGLKSRMKHYPAELSGGQQQRVAVARAIAGDPRLILADEPTGNLDSQMAREVMELLEQLNAGGTTVVIVTHDPELAARAHRNVHIVDGVAADLELGPSLVTPKRATAAQPHA